MGMQTVEIGYISERHMETQATQCRHLEIRLLHFASNKITIKVDSQVHRVVSRAETPCPCFEKNATNKNAIDSGKTVKSTPGIISDH